MKASPIAIALILATAACTVPSTRTREPTLSPRPLGRADAAEHQDQPRMAASDYTYQLLNPQQTGLAQVFDDGHRTFLSFATKAPEGLMIFDENGKSVAFSAVGETAVIDAIRRGWLIRTPTMSSYAQTRSPERVARLEASGAETQGVIALPAELAAARAEIISVQQQLQGLSAELDRASRGEPSAPLADLKSEIKEIQTRLNGVNATLVRAHFASGSALLALSEATRRALLGAANQAPWVRIRGGADSTGSAAINARVALARAQNVRRLLIEGGVAPDKVTMSAAIDDYVASNSTSQGRALNRRVDVFLGHPSGEAIHVTTQERPTSESKADIMASTGSQATTADTMANLRNPPN